ncbi:hypothetical protein T492DRAFT_1210 [Pavlovales sp. CCMP2436]|nr:hypothetical protein T492DRAFT_1210 [Pavlovales sp. CCMP2436]
MIGKEDEQGWARQDGRATSPSVCSYTTRRSTTRPQVWGDDPRGCGRSCVWAQRLASASLSAQCGPPMTLSRCIARRRARAAKHIFEIIAFGPDSKCNKPIYIEADAVQCVHVSTAHRLHQARTRGSKLCRHLYLSTGCGHGPLQAYELRLGARGLLLEREALGLAQRRAHPPLQLCDQRCVRALELTQALGVGRGRLGVSRLQLHLTPGLLTASDPR